MFIFSYVFLKVISDNDPEVPGNYHKKIIASCGLRPPFSFNLTFHYLEVLKINDSAYYISTLIIMFNYSNK